MISAGGAAVFNIKLAIAYAKHSWCLVPLAKGYGIDQKTVANWKKRAAVKGLPASPRDAHSTVLSIEEEGDHRRLRQAHVAFAGRLPLRVTSDDPASDALVAHRRLQRHGISRLREMTGDKPFLSKVEGRFGVGASTGYNRHGGWRRRDRLRRRGRARPLGGGKLMPCREFLIGWVEREGDTTMPELAARLARERQVVAVPLLRGTGLYRKKAAGERSRPR